MMRWLVCVCLGLFLWVPQTVAQGGQVVNFYIVPVVLDDAHGEVHVPKYLSPSTTPNWVTTTGDSTAVIHYGRENIALVAANLTPAEHASVAAQPDVLSFPAGNLDAPVSDINLAALQAALEGVKIPAGWINGTHTYREVIRFTRQLFLIFQRYLGQHGESLFDSGVTLTTRWNQLPVGVREKLRTVADQLQLDTSAITQTMTIRQILRLLGPQLPSVTVMGIPGL